MINFFCSMFANLQNGQLAKKIFVVENKKKITKVVLNFLWDGGFILGYKVINNQKKFKIFLKYNKNQPAIRKTKSMLKPRFSIYYSLKQIWKICSNKTFLILSTSKGLKTVADCKKLKVGGRVAIIIN